MSVTPWGQERAEWGFNPTQSQTCKSGLVHQKKKKEWKSMCSPRGESDFKIRKSHDTRNSIKVQTEWEPVNNANRIETDLWVTRRVMSEISSVHRSRFMVSYSLQWLEFSTLNWITFPVNLIKGVNFCGTYSCVLYLDFLNSFLWTHTSVIAR